MNIVYTIFEKPLFTVISGNCLPQVGHAVYVSNQMHKKISEIKDLKLSEQHCDIFRKEVESEFYFLQGARHLFVKLILWNYEKGHIEVQLSAFEPPSSFNDTQSINVKSRKKGRSGRGEDDTVLHGLFMGMALFD